MGVGAPRCTFVQFSWLGAWARCAPWAAQVSAEGLNRWPLAKLRRCNCAVVLQRKPSRVPRALRGGRMHCRPLFYGTHPLLYMLLNALLGKYQVLFAVRVKGAGTEGVPWRTRRAASSRSGRRLRRWTPTEIHRVVRWSAAKRR